MKKFTHALVGLLSLSFASACAANEFTLDQAIQAWSFMEGNWTLTGPEGQTFDVNVRLAPTKTAYVYELPQGLHIFGWDPKSRYLEIQSFMPDSSRRDSVVRPQIGQRTCRERDKDGREGWDGNDIYGDRGLYGHRQGHVAVRDGGRQVVVQAQTSAMIGGGTTRITTARIARRCHISSPTCLNCSRSVRPGRKGPVGNRLDAPLPVQYPATSGRLGEPTGWSQTDDRSLPRSGEGGDDNRRSLGAVGLRTRQVRYSKPKRCRSERRRVSGGCR